MYHTDTVERLGIWESQKIKRMQQLGYNYDPFTAIPKSTEEEEIFTKQIYDAIMLINGMETKLKSLKSLYKEWMREDDKDIRIRKKEKFHKAQINIITIILRNYVIKEGVDAVMEGRAREPWRVINLTIMINFLPRLVRRALPSLLKKGVDHEIIHGIRQQADLFEDMMVIAEDLE